LVTPRYPPPPLCIPSPLPAAVHQLTIEEWVKWGTTPGQDTSLVQWLSGVADLFRSDPMLPYLEAKLDPGAKRRQLASATKLSEAEIDRVQVGPAMRGSSRGAVRGRGVGFGGGGGGGGGRG
jgi:hypothetical protein